MIISDLSFLDLVSEDPGIVGGRSFGSFNYNFSDNYQSNRSSISQDADSVVGRATNRALVEQSNSIDGNSVG